MCDPCQHAVEVADRGQSSTVLLEEREIYRARPHECASHICLRETNKLACAGVGACRSSSVVRRVSLHGLQRRHPSTLDRLKARIQPVPNAVIASHTSRKPIEQLPQKTVRIPLALMTLAFT